MSNSKREANVKNFINQWKSKGYGQSESQNFWISLLSDVLEVKNPESYISFENSGKMDDKSFINAYIEQTKVLIEQKGSGKNLYKPIKQNDGTSLSPFESAKAYVNNLKDKKPEFVVICNFQKFLIFDMNRPDGEPREILLEDLEKDYPKLAFLVNSKGFVNETDEEISSGLEKVIKPLFETFCADYPENKKEAGLLCLKLLFCFYAENSGIFNKNALRDYISNIKEDKELIKLFDILNTPFNDRDTDTKPQSDSFPYVGGIFRDKNPIYPEINEKTRELILSSVKNFNLFEPKAEVIYKTVKDIFKNEKTKYYPPEITQKLTDLLFLNSFETELKKIKKLPFDINREKKLREFHRKISEIKIYDFNFSNSDIILNCYISLKTLENEVLAELHKGQKSLCVQNPLRVSFEQFIKNPEDETDLFILKTVLMIAQCQFALKTEKIVYSPLNIFPFSDFFNNSVDVNDSKDFERITADLTEENNETISRMKFEDYYSKIAQTVENSSIEAVLIVPGDEKSFDFINRINERHKIRPDYIEKIDDETNKTVICFTFDKTKK